MSIAAEKVKLATERFLLVRLTPARFIEPDFVSGTTYEMTFDFPIARIERNGTAISKVTALSGNDEFTYDETTGALQVRLASAPNSTTNILVAYYYLFYTGTVFRSVYEDPEDDTTTVRDWKPRIQSYPTIGQSFDNIVAGVFSIGNTSIELINADSEFQQYLTDDDSFYNKQVDVWLCINSADNIQKIFTGTVTGLSFSRSTVTLDVVDSFNKLQQPALMGDTVDEANFRRDAASFPDLNPNSNDRPCPYIVGSSSRYQTAGQSGGAVGAPDPYLLAVGTEAYCTDFTASPTTSNNRTWGCCRIKGSVATQAWGAIQATTVVGSYRFIRFASISNVAIGDTFKWTEAATTYYAVVNYVGTFTYSAVNYNIIVSDPTGTFTGGSTVAALKSFGLFIEAQNEDLPYLVPRYNRDYTVAETTTSGSNKYVNLTFTNNFEANFTGYALLKPDEHQVFFRTSNTTVQKHGDILKEIMGKVGLATSASTFTDADSTLAVNCRFHLPNFDEESADTYLKYVQDVLGSTLGYLKINSSFEVEYYLLAAPTSTEVRDDFLMIDQATRCEVEYSDISTKIIAYNPHNDSGAAIDAADTPAATGESAKAQYLHGLINVDRFRHVLEEMTSRIDAHISLKSMRRARYTFETATQDIDSELGTDLQLENSIVLGSSSTQDVKITSIEKSPARIRMEATDFKGL